MPSISSSVARASCGTAARVTVVPNLRIYINIKQILDNIDLYSVSYGRAVLYRVHGVLHLESILEIVI